MQFLNAPTRNLFFTGKGGVGKTSMACATAVQLADRGLRVLLVSTDPASNLDEVLGTQLANEPTAIESVPNLFAMNIDPEDSRPRISRTDGRPVSRRIARRGGGQHGGTVFRFVYAGDRGLRRVREVAR